VKQINKRGCGSSSHWNFIINLYLDFFIRIINRKIFFMNFNKIKFVKHLTNNAFAIKGTRRGRRRRKLSR
jgi:hypothetical protein